MHKVHIRTTAVAVLISICLVVTGCTTTRTLPLPQSAGATQSSGVEAGDKVVVLLRSGETRTFRVTAVETDALVGKNVRIAFADIAKLQQKNFSLAKTSGMVAGTLAVLGGAFVYMLVQVSKDSD